MRRSAIRLSVLPPTLRTILSTTTPAQINAVSSSSSSSTSTSTDSNHTAGNGNQEITVNGWIKSIRTHKNVSFVEVNDGSSGRSLQAVLKGKGKADGLTNGTSVKLIGELKKSRGQGQDVELSVRDIEVLGECDAEAYPIQKKSLPPSVLRENAHLRFRTSQTAAVMRVRDAVMRDWHDWFEENDFTHIHTPILTGSDCEGAGEVFTLLDQPKSSQPSSSSSSSSIAATKEDRFFPHNVNLTVSSQLHLESPTHSLNRVYTLSPCFRAEPSLTSRHLSEFYMLEGELGFIDTLDELLNVVEDGIKQTLTKLLNSTSNRSVRLRDDIKVISKSLEQQEQDKQDSEVDIPATPVNNVDPLDHLNQIISKPFTRITYTEALDILSKELPSTTNQEIPKWGESISTENEKWLASYFNGPLFITRYPKNIKPFYMLPTSTSTSGPVQNCKETVECFDLLFPQIGEMAGGSLREHDHSNLVRSLKENGMKPKQYDWYLDLRKYGSIKHGGWGMGFERWISYLTKIQNIKDVIAYPRWKGHCKY
ncbi:asparagine-tRNA ligase [Kwoniella dendrophila CBS 6074]|uniref:asparagine--tRNA ligase n=1 Tax=Kwoniella dendrophila CBS 6074 TaxID=1295534 RepID=A0AAX4JVT0_9TREE